MYVSRRVLRQFRNVFKKAVIPISPRGTAAPVRIAAGPEGFLLHGSGGDIGLSLRTGGEPQPAEEIAFPAELLGRLEGADETLVEIVVTEGQGEARWSESGIDRRIGFAPIDPAEVPRMVELAEPLTPMPADFIDAFDAASRTAGKDRTKYAVDRVQLRGKAGEVVATDTRQLLISGGFSFPFEADALVPALPLFHLKEFSRSGPSLLGRNETHVVLQVDGWQFDLKVEGDVRFPDAKAIVPKREAANGVRFGEADIDLLLGVLAKLPKDDGEASVTLDWRTNVYARAAVSGANDVVEVRLPDSQGVGQPLAVALNPRHLERLLKLGFRELRCVDPERPLIARDARRTYLTMPLDKGSVLPPVVRQARVPAAEVLPPPEPLIVSIPENVHSRSTAMQAIGATHSADPVVLEATDPLEEAEALKSALAEVLNRVGRLAAALRALRTDSPVLRKAVGSLRQLAGKP